MAVLARASANALASAIITVSPRPAYRCLRGPEIGLTMLRGRAGGDGAAFNLGEATITRCSVALEGGTVGHSWRLGRDRQAAEHAALLDALLQSHPQREALHAAIIAPLAARQRADSEATARKAAATEVRFATMATMR